MPEIVAPPDSVETLGLYPDDFLDRTITDAFVTQTGGEGIDRYTQVDLHFKDGGSLTFRTLAAGLAASSIIVTGRSE